MKVDINELMRSSGVQFGTSGVRGLVKDMTDKVCVTYVSAFLQYLKNNPAFTLGAQVGIAGDLRSSSPRIMNAAAIACKQLGFEPVNYGHIPSPAVALWGMHQKIPTIMVTGSHIPDDRNGIKFNTPEGEILKADEEGIRAQQVAVDQTLFNADDQSANHDSFTNTMNHDAEAYYIQRFTDFLPDQCLHGSHIGLYEHSSVSRDCIKTILQKLGATVTSLGRSDAFISVDTEAIRPEDVVLANDWASQYQFDCIISTDGDGDRPLVSDEHGNWLRGDVAGILCAQFLQADNVVTPVSSNSAVEKSNLFNQVIRTRIGSPYVIAAMQQSNRDAPSLSVVGYEANGGFLQQTPLTKNTQILSPLPTRDALIVPLAILLLAKQHHQPISALLGMLPARYTYSDRLKEMPTALSHKMLGEMVKGTLEENIGTIQSYFPALSEPVQIDTTDGVRITLATDDVVHLRASGNAPELRCYSESDTAEKAEALNKACIQVMKTWLN